MLKNKKVILESVNHCDIKKFQAWRNNPELRKYFREYREISDDMQEAWFSKISQDKNQKDILRSELLDLYGIGYIFSDKPINRFKSKLKIEDKQSKLANLKGEIQNIEIFDNTELAFKLTFFNKCNESDKKVISELYQRCFRKELE